MNEKIQTQRYALFAYAISGIFSFALLWIFISIGKGEMRSEDPSMINYFVLLIDQRDSLSYSMLTLLFNSIFAVILSVLLFFNEIRRQRMWLYALSCVVLVIHVPHIILGFMNHLNFNVQILLFFWNIFGLWNVHKTIVREPAAVKSLNL